MWTTLSQPPEIRMFSSIYLTAKTRLSWPTLFQPAGRKSWMTVFVSIWEKWYIRHKYGHGNLYRLLRSFCRWGRNQGNWLRFGVRGWRRGVLGWGREGRSHVLLCFSSYVRIGSGKYFLFALFGWSPPALHHLYFMLVIEFSFRSSDLAMNFSWLGSLYIRPWSRVFWCHFWGQVREVILRVRICRRGYRCWVCGL